MVSLFLAGLVHACTITPSSATGNTNTPLIFNVDLNGATPLSKDCGDNLGRISFIGNTFSCTYSSTGNKQINILIRKDTIETCTASASISAPSNSPPVVSISSPASGAMLTSGQAFTFTGSASDDGSVASLKLQIATDNGCGDGVWNPVTFATPWGYIWNSVPAGKSNCKANVKARDNLGLETTASVTFSTSAAQAAAPQGQPAQQPAAPQGQTCTASCSAKKKTVCTNGIAAVTNVACCEASDCTSTCVNGKYKTPTCSANVCSYGTADYVAGKCNFLPSCSITRPNQTITNVNTILLVKFKNLTQSAPKNTTLNCGNGKNTNANCTGTKTGECIAFCNYTRSATVTPSATLNGMTCETGSIAVTTTAAQNSGVPAGAQALAQHVSCILDFKTTALTTERIEVKIKYNGTTMPPGLVNVKCGNGKIVTAPGCISNVYGNGECNANCIYDSIGIYTPSAQIQTINCTSRNVNVAGGVQSNSGELNVQDITTTPTSIAENTATVLNAAIKSSVAVKNVSCKSSDNSQSSCTCMLSQTIAPNPDITCAVQPPVRGTYEITLTSQDGKSKSMLISLTPGQTPTTNSSDGNYSNYALIVIATVLVLFGIYFAYSKLVKKN
ncbi:MAG: Ig-like domain-containing protein [Candidatus Micrarchaeota archaeon]